MPPNRKYNFRVNSLERGIRLDKFLAQKISSYSRAYFQKLIEQQCVTVEGRAVKPSYKLVPGEIVEVAIPPPEKTALQPENIPLKVLYEDRHLLVIDKPPGMVVHPGAGVLKGTLVNALLYHCQDLSGVGGRLRPGIVHRLDKDTSGLIVVAKDDETHVALQKQFTLKSVSREYKALVWGRLNQRAGKIETRVGRSKRDRKKFVVASEGKLAITFFEVEKLYAFLTLVCIHLKTGRSHQIRIHFQYLHHPVFGDPVYSGRQKQVGQLSRMSQKQLAMQLLKLMPRQALHAYRLGFEHPIKRKWLEYTAPLPVDFQKTLEVLEREENYL